MHLKLVGLAVLVTAASLHADVPVRAQRVASGLSSPLFVAAPPGDPSRLFILEQGSSGSASIKILNLNTGVLNTDPFLTISGLATGGEQGLLGLAFHPNYVSNGQFYVNVTEPGGAFGNGVTHIRRYNRSGDPDIANPGSAQTVLTFDQPQDNHNGGWLGFGPNDGFLYVATGDGGAGNDEGTGHTPGIGNAQDITDNLLGKMLRLDVNSDEFPADNTRNYAIPRGGTGQPPANPFAATTGDDEIWSYGLRNPWRASFDRQTGDLYIGDVGQDAQEEIDFAPAASAGGENYGWRAMEGTLTTGFTPVPPQPPRVDPILVYGHAVGFTVIGGNVYRGDENDALDGVYFFGDAGTGRVWSFKFDGQTITKFTDRSGVPVDVGAINIPVSFGEDALGRLYVVDLAGEVFRYVPALPGDANLDQIVELSDFSTVASNFNVSGLLWRDGDFNDDQIVDISDFAIMAANWQQTGGRAAIPEPAMPAIAALVSLIPRRRCRF